MSVRTTATTATNAPLPMKKVRPASAAKKDVPKAPRAKKAAAGAASKNGSKSSSPTRPQSSRDVGNKDKAGDELDNITSGIKKITLVTNKQKVARARENKKPAVDGAPGSSLPVTPNEDLPTQEGSLSTSGNATPHSASPGKAQELIQQEMPATPTIDTAQEDTAKVETPTGPLPQVESSTPDVFVPFQPDGPMPETLTPQAPLNWLPVNTGATPSPLKQAAPANTPSPVKQEVPAIKTPSPVEEVTPAAATPSPMKRNNLPIFTPTSQLIFAPRSAEQPSSSSTSPKVKAERKLDDAIWEVPETPE